MRSLILFVTFWLVLVCVLTFGNEEPIQVEQNLGAVGNTDIPTTSAVNAEEETLKVEENGREKAFTVEELKAMSVSFLLFNLFQSNPHTLCISHFSITRRRTCVSF